MGSSCNSKAQYAETDKNNDLPVESESSEGKAVHDGSIFGLRRLSETRVVSCGEDAKVALFDWNAPDQTKYFEGHTKPVNRVG